ncbi:MAG: hypothetical protein LUC86_01330 [Prevotellaceae bacterium]|nr:hypothetical protein [Prevotellaceae bacterium]
MSRKLLIPRIPVPEAAVGVPRALDEACVPWSEIGCQPWASQYPYKPRAQFRLAHSGQSLHLHFRVLEEWVAALAPQDNGRVWEDSCVELFLQPEGEGLYYNIECNCACALLVGAGQGRADRLLAPLELLRTVSRWSSLGRGVLPLRQPEGVWELALSVPASLLFLHPLGDLSGLSMRGNVYKCGDRLPKPHFLTWSPISLAKPDFHCPQFFAPMLFA